MAHSKQIMDELNSISQLVATFPPESPYQVPLEYFASLPEIIMSRIKSLEQDEINFQFIQDKQDTPYRIPENYFNELSDTILKKIKSEEAFTGEEQEMLSPLLLQLKKASTFKLPSEYFEELPLAILNRIKSEELASDKDELEILSPLLGQLKKSVPFKLPKGYFDEFPSNIIAGVNAIDYVNLELESQAPVMNDLKIKDAYKVPERYFDKLEDELIRTVKHRRKAPVISFNFNKKILRYGIAALVAGIMSIAAWNFYNNKQGLNAGNEFADIEKISNDEMINYLETTPVAPGENTATALFTMKEDDVKDILADVPDEELQQYLEQHAVSKDLIIN